MMRSSSPAKSRHDSRDIDMDTIARTTYADEEAQLLGRDGVEIEDTILPVHTHKPRKNHLWDRLQGPEPPKVHTIRPLFPSIQKRPLQLLASHGINKKALYIILLLSWSTLFTLFLTSQLPIQDNQGTYVINLDCTDTLWKRNNECGLNGLDCQPFNHRSFAFRCPANCAGVRVLNPRHVGPVDVNYRPLVIGDNPWYRGDSFVCGAAIHAGVVDDGKGGCGRVALHGAYGDFTSAVRNGVESIAFDSSFPLSFEVRFDERFKCRTDPRSSLLLVSLIFTAALSIFSTSPAIFFPIFVLIFAHVSFVSDPPQASHRNITVLPDHISMFAKRILPAIFIAIVMYRLTIKRTLSGLTAQYEKTILWLGGFWIGALSNYTFDWIPIARLTAHDLEQQPGAKLALFIIIMILLVIILGQAYSFWLEGRLPHYLGLYGLFISAILVCLAIPGVNLRIHHYILALLLLPGTSLQTRPSLLYQGILLGLFVNGIARWDLDSVLQTSEALRADAMLQSVVPQVLPPVIETNPEGFLATFMWAPPVALMDGISVLINDVERARIFVDTEADWEKNQFHWPRWDNASMNEYFRWAFVKDGKTLDYSKAGVLSGNGTWIPEV